MGPKQRRSQSNRDRFLKRVGSVPWVFGRGMRERMLLSLHANGPLQTVQLTRALGCDEKKVRRALRHFCLIGVVAKCGRLGHRRYWTLDRRFAAHHELRSLLVELARLVPPTRFRGPTRRLGSVGRTPRRLDRAVEGLFGSVTRTRVLLAAAALTDPSLREVCRLACVRYESVVYAVNRFERDGLLRTVARGRDRRVSFADDQPLARSLRPLVVRIAMRLNSAQ